MEEKTLLVAGVKLVGLLFMIWGLFGIIQILVQSSVVPTPSDLHVGALVLPPIIEMAVGLGLISKNRSIVEWLIHK